MPRVHIVIPDELLARVDAALADGMSRGHFVRKALERELTDPPLGLPLRPRTAEPGSMDAALQLDHEDRLTPKAAAVSAPGCYERVVNTDAMKRMQRK